MTRFMMTIAAAALLHLCHLGRMDSREPDERFSLEVVTNRRDIACASAGAVWSVCVPPPAVC